MALTSSNIEAVEKHGSVTITVLLFIFTFRRKYLLKLTSSSPKMKMFLVGMVSMSTCNFF